MARAVEILSSFLELFPMVIDLANSCEAFYTDKTTIVDIIHKQSSKHPLVMFFLIRVSVLTSFKLISY